MYKKDVKENVVVSGWASGIVANAHHIPREQKLDLLTAAVVEQTDSNVGFRKIFIESIKLCFDFFILKISVITV